MNGVFCCPKADTSTRCVAAIIVAMFCEDFTESLEYHTETSGYQTESSKYHTEISKYDTDSLQYDTQSLEYDTERLEYNTQSLEYHTVGRPRGLCGAEMDTRDLAVRMSQLECLRYLKSLKSSSMREQSIG